MADEIQVFEPKKYKIFSRHPVFRPPDEQPVSPIFDPSEPPSIIPELEFPPPREPEGYTLRQATDLEVFRKRPPLPSNATPEERFDRALHIVGDPVIWSIYKVGKGLMLGMPDIGWAAIKRILPPDMYEQVKDQSLDEAILESMGYDPGGFARIVGEISELTGALRTGGALVKSLGKPAGAHQAASRTALVFGSARAGREASKAIAEAVDFDAKYDYQGAGAVAISMGIGAGFSYLGTAAGYIKNAILGTHFGKSLEEGVNNIVIDVTKRFPVLMDVVRKNPDAYFTERAFEHLEKTIGLSAKDMSAVQKAAVRHVARELARRYRLAFREYLRKVPPDVIHATKAKKQLLAGTYDPFTGIVEAAAKAGDTTLPTKLHALRKTVHEVQVEMKIGSTQYRSLATKVTGKPSSADMDESELLNFIKAMQETNPSENLALDSFLIRAVDIGVSDLPSELADYRAHAFTQQTKRVKRTFDKMAAAKAAGKEHSIISYWEPARIAIAGFEDDTSIPVSYAHYTLVKAAKMRAYKASEEFGKMVAGLPSDAIISPKDARELVLKIEDAIANLTVAENERIASWLYSRELREDVEPLMSEKELSIANTLEEIAQNSIMASERMEEALRLWITRGVAPKNVHQFTTEQQREIFEQAKTAYQAGTLKRYTQSLFKNNVRFGLREYYYPADGEHVSLVLETIRGATSGPLSEMPVVGATPPSLIGRETLPRKGVGKPRSGSVYANFLKSYERVAVRNEIARSLEKLYKRYNRVDLSANDRRYLEELYSSVLLKGEPLPPPYDILAKMHSVFWRTYLSFLTNPFGSLRATTRNALQGLTEGGQALNVHHFFKAGERIAKTLAKGGSLEDIDSELAEDFMRPFIAYMNQRGSQYRESMFIEIGKRARATNVAQQLVQYITMLLDRTGFAYIGVDTVSRAVLWPTVYMTVKDAAIDYHAGKISLKRFFALTNIDTMMKDSQTNTAIDLLGSGDNRALANYIADTYTFDVFRAYAAEERAGIERTGKRRTLAGIYVYPRGVYDLYYNRGLRPLFEGIKAGNYARAMRGASNIAKGMAGRFMSNIILVGLGLGSMVALRRTMYSPLQPGLNITLNTLYAIRGALFKHVKKEITTDELIAALAKIIYKGADDLIHILPELPAKEEQRREKREKRESR